VKAEEPELRSQGGYPFSVRFNDIYYNEDGAGESRYTFIDSISLGSIFNKPGQVNLSLCETGFGTGLNFLLTASLFLSATEGKKNGNRLFYTSVERYPLNNEQIREALGKTEAIDKDFLAQVLKKMPPLVNGLHRVELAGGKVVLTLFYGDISDFINRVEPRRGFDLWFLDGFRPSSNPEMWSETLFAFMGANSTAGARVATFTAAGIVRRGLELNGFKVEKIKGYGPKREMITASFESRVPRTDRHPWLPSPGSVNVGNVTASDRQVRVAVIGGGMSGCSLANSFARRGYDVDLYEKKKEIALEASGNPWGIFFPVIHQKPSLISRFALNAYYSLIGKLKELDEAGFDTGFHQTGLLQLSVDEESGGGNSDKIERFNRLYEQFACGEPWVRGATQNELSFFNAEKGFFYPLSGYLSPRLYCQALLQQFNTKITTHVTSEVLSLKKQGELWQLYGVDMKLLNEADVVVLANACDAVRFPQGGDCGLEPFRGQLMWIDPPQSPLRFACPVAGGGYLIPGNEMWVAGATYDHSSEPALRESDQRAISEGVRAFFPEFPLFGEEGNQRLQGRVAFRCAGRDHFPVIGPLPEPEGYLERFADLANGPAAYFRGGAVKKYSEQTGWADGLFILSGVGSRGLIYSRLGAEIIAAGVSGEPLPVENDIIRALHPARFLYRSIIRV